ncbi:hypothetical protein HK101_007827 [Irineochytrium annulatum]|nr:hypothetical protein HK101_007827 [Irineochytrium annulatum]
MRSPNMYPVALFPAATNEDVDPESLLRSYPLLPSDIDPPPRPRRRPFAEPLPAHWPWWDRLFMTRFRRLVARGACSAFINNRLPVGGGRESIAPETAPPYFPDVFVEGAGAAPAVWARAISGWDGSDEDAGRRRLEQLMKPQVLELFRKAHATAAQKGCAIHVSVTRGDGALRVSDVWATFGRARWATSTLLMGPIVGRLAPHAFTRRVKESGKSFMLFREVTFEYCLGGMEDPDNGASFQEKREAIKEGQVFGVDVEMEAEVHISVRRKVGEDEEPGELLYREKCTRDLMLRFESEHFIEKFKGSWRIADVDAVLLDARVREEEKGTAEDDDE